MSIFDARQGLLEAGRNIAPGLPPPLLESAESAFDDVAKNDLSLSEDLLLSDAYDRYLDGVRQLTGQNFDNPIDLPETGIFGIESQLRTPRPPREVVEAELNEKIAKLKEKFPDLGVKSPADIRAEIIALRASARSRREKLAAREDTLGAIAAFGGSAAAFLIDPPVLASMLLGAPFSTGVLRGALTDAAIAGAVEIPIQAKVQLTRERLGEGGSFGAGLANVATVTAGGFLLSGALRGAVKGSQAGGRAVERGFFRQRAAARVIREAIEGTEAGAVRARLGIRALAEESRAREGAKSRIERDAQAFLERKIELEDATPFDREAAGARLEHEQRLSEAQLAAREGRAPNIPDEPRSPVSGPVFGRAGQKTVSFEEGPLAELEQALNGAAKDLQEAGRARIEELEAGKRGAEFFRPLFGDVAEFGRVIETLRRPPPRLKPKSLTQFVKEKGGLKESKGELNAIGITSRSRPGLINNRSGQTLDDAALDAFEAGFFPLNDARPTINEFLVALADDIQKRPQRFRPEDELLVAERAEIDDALEVLSRVGIDPRRLADAEILARLQEIAARAAAADELSGATGRAVSDARAGGGALDELDAEMERFDAVIERQVRAEAAGKEGERVFVADDDGNIIERRIQDVFEDLEQEEILLREFNVCLGLA